MQMIKLMAKKPHEKKSQIQAVMRELTSKKMMEHVREWMEPPDGDRLTSVRHSGLLQLRLILPAVALLQPSASLGLHVCMCISQPTGDTPRVPNVHVPSARLAQRYIIRVTDWNVLCIPPGGNFRHTAAAAQLPAVAETLCSSRSCFVHAAVELSHCIHPAQQAQASALVCPEPISAALAQPPARLAGRAPAQRTLLKVTSSAVLCVQADAFLLASPILQYGAPHKDDGSPGGSAKAFEVREGKWNAGAAQFLKREALQGYAILTLARRCDTREACSTVRPSSCSQSASFLVSGHGSAAEQAPPTTLPHVHRCRVAGPDHVEQFRVLGSDIRMAARNILQGASTLTCRSTGSCPSSRRSPPWIWIRTCVRAMCTCKARPPSHTTTECGSSRMPSRRPRARACASTTALCCLCRSNVRPAAVLAVCCSAIDCSVAAAAASASAPLVRAARQEPMRGKGGAGVQRTAGSLPTPALTSPHSSCAIVGSERVAAYSSRATSRAPQSARPCTPHSHAPKPQPVPLLRPPVPELPACMQRTLTHTSM